MIPEEAIEAAARALDPGTMGSGGALAERFQDQVRAEARAVLEAAEPYIRAALADDLDGEFTEIRQAQGKSFDWLAGIADAESRIRDLSL